MTRITLVLTVLVTVLLLPGVAQAHHKPCHQLVPCSTPTPNPTPTATPTATPTPLTGPVAEFSWSPTDPVGAPVTVSFDASASDCPAGPCSYRWLHAGVEFGTGMTTTFTYQGLGTKTVTLSVTDSLGRTSSVNHSFTVTAEATPTPTATPTVDPTVTPTPTPPPSGSCDLSVASRDALASAMSNVANSGKTVCVTASLSGSEISTSTDMTSRMRVLAQPADGTIDSPSVSFSGASNITYEGFDFTNNHGVDIGNGANGIHIVRNRFHDQVQDAIMYGVNANTKILANRIERIGWDGNWPHGYGVYGSSDTQNMEIGYNLCDMGNQESGDCFELGNVHGLNFHHNDVKNVIGSSAAHADALMVYNDSTFVTVKDNQFRNISGLLPSPDGTDHLFENNLVAHCSGRCIDMAPNGTSGSTPPLRWVWRNNTLWDSYTWNDAVLVGGGYSGSGSQQFYDNIIENGSASGVTAASGNVSRAGIGGLATYNPWTPFWSTSDYQPSNLPMGYENAGYHPVPVGPAAYAG